MKTKSFLLIFILLVNICQAENKKETESKIEKVTVYLEGAQVTRTAEVAVDKGQQTLIFVRNTTDLTQGSIQVSCENPEVKILSVSHKFDFLENKTVIKETEQIYDQLQNNRLLIDKYRSMKDVYIQEKELLLVNKNIGGDDGVKIDELKSAANYYRERLQDIEFKLLDLKNKIDSITKSGNRLNAQLNELNYKKEQDFINIVVEVESSQNTEATFEIEYLTQNAGWLPVYDIRVDEINNPLSINCKALVKQNTDEDWEDVKLSLSTGEPLNNEVLPELEPWRLGFWNPYSSMPRTYYKQQSSGYSGSATLKGKVFDEETGEPVPFSNVVVELGGTQVGGASTDFEGNYIIKFIQPGKYDVKASFVGYKTKKIQGVIITPDIVTFLNIPIEASSVALDEVVVTDYQVPLSIKDKILSGAMVTSEEIAKMPNRSASGYASDVGGVRGARSEGQVVYLDGVKKSDNIEPTQFQSIVEYNIEMPYSIPSDNKDYTVNIKEISIDGIYSYKSVPKLSENAFLICGIVDWEGLDLVPGPVNLFYQNSFIGDTYLDTYSTEDTINLSLGVDNNIIVKRERITDYQESQFIGSNITKKIGWKISVRNNKNKEIELVISDQVPLPTTKEIDVDLEESSNAEYNEESGELKWKLQLAPQESKELVLKYEVKYPKYKKVVLE